MSNSKSRDLIDVTKEELQSFVGKYAKIKRVPTYSGEIFNVIIYDDDDIIINSISVYRDIQPGINDVNNKLYKITEISFSYLPISTPGYLWGEYISTEYELHIVLKGISYIYVGDIKTNTDFRLFSGYNEGQMFC